MGCQARSSHQVQLSERDLGSCPAVDVPLQNGAVVAFATASYAVAAILPGAVV